MEERKSPLYCITTLRLAWHTFIAEVAISIANDFLFIAEGAIKKEKEMMKILEEET